MKFELFAKTTKQKKVPYSVLPQGHNRMARVGFEPRP